MNNTKDKPECFAWINEKICNALNEKKCENCNFYKHKSEVPNYGKYLAMGKKEIKEKGLKHDGKK